MITQELQAAIISAADRYETPSFIINDPVQFPHRYSRKTDIEISALLTATISFGRRCQILKKAEHLCDLLGSSPTGYIKNREFEKHFACDDNSSFYRTISHAFMRSLLEKLWIAYSEDEDLEMHLYRNFEGIPMQRLCSFLKISQHSPQKKANMFLRWMIRRDSPVDFGIWNKFNAKDLIIPLDTHVLHMACETGLCHNASYSLASAKHITQILANIFPNDPVRGDFALFGIGINKEKGAR